MKAELLKCCWWVCDWYVVQNSNSSSTGHDWVSFRGKHHREEKKNNRTEKVAGNERKTTTKSRKFG